MYILHEKMSIMSAVTMNSQSVRETIMTTRMSHGDTNRGHNKNDTPSPIGVMTKVPGLQFKVHN